MTILGRHQDDIEVHDLVLDHLLDGIETDDGKYHPHVVVIALYMVNITIGMVIVAILVVEAELEVEAMNIDSEAQIDFVIGA